MKSEKSAFVVLLLLVGSVLAGDRVEYDSRLKEWMPYVSKTVVVSFLTRVSPATTRGLVSGSFSAHLRCMEPHAMRANGTPMTGNAVVTEEELAALLKAIDQSGTQNNFTTCNDDNFRRPMGALALAKVVWRGEKGGHTYDWYVLSSIDMLKLLQQVRGSLHGTDALKVIDGLAEGFQSNL
jgi:hypothetical protein